MMYIAHRGNIDGPVPSRENSPIYIREALDAGFYVEADIWGKDGSIWLGHDAPTYPAPMDLIIRTDLKVFKHCKNVEAINILRRELEWPTFFVHDVDDYTLTSNGFVWCFPSRTPPQEDAIVVMPEKWMQLHQFVEYASKYRPSGVCSDYVNQLKYK